MVTIEDIEQTKKELEKIKKQIPKREINENLHFDSIEEMRAFFQSEPLDEFEKKFRSGN